MWWLAVLTCAGVAAAILIDAVYGSYRQRRDARRKRQTDLQEFIRMTSNHRRARIAEEIEHLLTTELLEALGRMRKP